MKKNYLLLALLLLICLPALMSCAPSGHTREQYGFLSGILHGFVFIFALIGKLFGGDYGLYAENNTGFFYWLGFILGLGLLGGGGERSVRRR